MANPQAVNAAALNSTCYTGNIFQYLLSAIYILILLYAIVKMIIRGIHYFRRYQTTAYFMCQHEHDKGPFTVVALELSTMSEITHVHISIYLSPDYLFMKLTTMLTTLCPAIGSMTLLNYPNPLSCFIGTG